MDDMQEAIKFVERGCYMAYDMDIELNKRRLQTVLRAAHAPPVQDDVAAAIDRATGKIEYELKPFTGWTLCKADLDIIIRAASKPPVPADTIAVPKEVLQGVREALVTARLLAIMHFNFKSETEQTFEKCLATLDAVLEGK